MELKILKNEYGKLQKKYKLPKFDELNKDFEIDKIERDTDYLLKSIRKLLMEKVVNSMGFLDMLLNPVNAPRMYVPYIRTIGVEDKKRIDFIYGILAELSLLSLELEIIWDEKKEAELIRAVFTKWHDIKKPFSEIIENMMKPRNLEKKERNYFG